VLLKVAGALKFTERASTMAQSKFRFSIRAILIATGYTAIAVAALVNPTKPWLGVMYGITVAMLFFSLLGMIYRTERARAFWTGFALFGFGYLGLIFGPFSELSAKLPTSLVLEYTLYKFHGPSMSPYGVPTTYYPSPVTTYSTPSYAPSSTTAVPTTPYPSAAVPVDIPVTDSAPAASSTIPDRDELPSNLTDETSPDVEDESTSGPPDTTSISPTSSTPPPFTAPTTYYPPSSVTPSSSAPSYYTPSYSGPSFPVPLINYSMDAYYYFSAIGNAGFALLFAAIGGLVAQFLFALRAGEPSPCAKE
jgi:hypothetical protein